MDVRLAFLAQDKLYLKCDDQPPRLIESPFAQSVIDRGVRDRQRNEWKQQNAAGFAPMMWGARRADPTARRIAMTGLAAGPEPHEISYCITIDNVGGIFVYDMRENQERRLLHRNGFRAADLSRNSTNGMLALSLKMEDWSANLATLEASGRGVRELTEGDSIDQAPAWVPGDENALVFQSAGLGRNQLGHVAETGPFAIQKLDTKSGEMTTLLEDIGTDYLLPKLAADGSLYFIQRPYQPSAGRLHPGKLVIDIVLFPYRLLRAIIAFLNFFSLMFSRKPLLTAGGPPKEPIQQREMMLWGKFIDADKVMKSARDGQAPALVPPSWKLMRKTPDGQIHTLATGVLSFDLLRDGEVIYTNGSSVFRTKPGAEPEKICEGKMIEHVVALD